ncbi:hypothetical protein IT568_03915 [bacterium]|nr:hypothetical protein [bacterium]
MNLNDLIAFSGSYSKFLTVVFVLTPLFAFVYGKVHSKGNGTNFPHKFVYSFLVYFTCVPGIFSSVLIVYSIFFLKTNLLQVNFFVYFLPVLSMIFSLAIIKKNVELDFVPGFDRLVGLCTLLSMTFAVVFFLLNTRVWLVFGSSFLSLVLLVTFVFLLLKWGFYTFFRSKNEPKIKPPKFPEL